MSNIEKQSGVSETNPLAKRQLEILHYIAQGYTGLAIADIQNVTFHTIKSQINAIHKRLHVFSSVEAVITCIQMGLIEINEAIPVTANLESVTELSMAKLETLELVARGLSNKEIAKARGGKSVITARNHVDDLMTELNVNRRIHLAAIGLAFLYPDTIPSKHEHPDNSDDLEIDSSI